MARRPRNQYCVETPVGSDDDEQRSTARLAKRHVTFGKQVHASGDNNIATNDSDDDDDDNDDDNEDDDDDEEEDDDTTEIFFQLPGESPPPSLTFGLFLLHLAPPLSRSSSHLSFITSGKATGSRSRSSSTSSMSAVSLPPVSPPLTSSTIGTIHRALTLTGNGIHFNSIFF